MSFFLRKAHFRSDVHKAYRIICEKGMVDSGELQYMLNISQGPFYRIRRALLAMFPDVEHVNGYFKLKTEPPKGTIIDHWGEIQPEINSKKEA